MMPPDQDHREMTFLEHFEELRRRLYLAFIGIIVSFIICWFFSDYMFGIVAEPYYKLASHGQKLTVLGLTDAFFVYMKIAFFTGLIFSSPWVFYQLWAFISPGLKSKEKRFALPFVIGTTFFFVAGVLFCYYAVLPLTIRYFLSFNKNFVDRTSILWYWSFFFKFHIGIGLTFETPVLIFFLAKLGFVTWRFLISKFKYAIVISFIVSAIVTPSQDMFTQTVVAIPLILLYAIGILVAFLFGKKPDQ